MFFWNCHDFPINRPQIFDFGQSVWQTEEDKKNMTTLAQITSDANAQASDPNLAQNDVIEHGRDLSTSLIIAKANRAIQTLLNTAANPMHPHAGMSATMASSLQSEISSHPSISTHITWGITPSQAIITRLNGTLWALRTKLTNQLANNELLALKSDLDNLIRTNIGTIRFDEWLILFIAELKHLIEEKEVNTPNSPVIRPPVLPNYSSLPINITGDRMWWIPASQKIEIFDATGTNKLAEQAPWAIPFSLSLTTLPNGNLPYILRATNPTTNVYIDTPFNLNISVPKAPEAPENLVNTLTTSPTQRARVGGKLKTPSHRIELRYNNGRIVNIYRGTWTPPPLPTDAVITGPNASNWEFSIDFPMIASNTDFKVVITNWNSTQDHIENVTVNVVAQNNNPTTPRITIPNHVPHIGWTTIQKDEHHAHIHLDHPVDGSRITIAGPGLPSPVVMNLPNPIPPDMLNHGHLNIDLPGLDTHTAGRKSGFTITQEDPNHPENKRTDNFDITIEEDPHHLPDNRKIGEAAFLAATRATPRVYTLQNDHPAGRTYRIWRLKRAFGAGFWAEVPVLPGEEKLFDRPRTVKATSRRALYAKVREYLKDLNARAAAMNHGDHDEHGHEWHDDKHEKDNHEKGEKHEKEHKKWEEKHEKWGHSEDHGSESSSDGSFWSALKTVALAPVKLFNKQPAWVRGAEIGLGYAMYSGGAVLMGPAVVAGAALGGIWWGAKKLWRIKNPPKWSGDSHGHH